MFVNGVFFTWTLTATHKYTRAQLHMHKWKSGIVQLVTSEIGVLTTDYLCMCISEPITRPMFACLCVRALHIIAPLPLVGVFVGALAATLTMRTTVPEVAKSYFLAVAGHAHSFGYPFMYLFR